MTPRGYACSAEYTEIKFVDLSLKYENEDDDEMRGLCRYLVGELRDECDRYHYDDLADVISTWLEEHE